MDRHFTIFILTTLMGVLCAFAQPNKRQALLISRVGDDYFGIQEYEYAMRYYRAAFEEYPEFIEARFQIAQCYRLIEQYDSASHHYGFIIDNGQDFRYPLARYYLAMIQLETNQVEAALLNFKAFTSLLVENEQQDHEKFKKFYIQAMVEIDKLEK